VSKKGVTEMLSIQKCRFLQSFKEWMNNSLKKLGMQGIFFVLVVYVFKCI